MRKAIVLIIVFFLYQNLFPQKIEDIKLEDLIPKKDQLSMGLNKLNEVEKEKLRKYIINLLLQALEKGLEEGKKINKSSSSDYQELGGKHWIQKNIDNGTYIILEDYSLWEIDPLDRIDASLWLPTSNITVLKSTTGSPGYDYLLINTDDGEKAHAKYIKK